MTEQTQNQEQNIRTYVDIRRQKEDEESQTILHFRKINYIPKMLDFYRQVVEEMTKQV